MLSRGATAAVSKTLMGLSARRMAPAQTRAFSPSSSLLSSNTGVPHPLDAFRDPVDRHTRGTETVGRSWTVTELRRKSYDDLHKLWYVLYMERNMLLTERQLSRRRQLVFPQPERMTKVKKSMGAIKQVLGERKRSKIAAHQASKLEESLQAEAEAMDYDVEDTEEKPKK